MLYHGCSDHYRNSPIRGPNIKNTDPYGLSKPKHLDHEPDQWKFVPKNPDHGADQEKSGPRNPDLYREILEWVNRNGVELSKF